MVVLDTNILIDYLTDDPTVVRYVDRIRTRAHLAISVVTEVELFSSPALRSGEERRMDHFLRTMEIVDLDSHLARRVAFLRRTVKPKLGDAIIAATAQYLAATLITRDRDLAKRAQRAGILVEII